MPFLTRQRFEDLVGKAMADNAAREPGSFDSIEPAVAREIQSLTGLAIPDDPTTTPAEIELSAAHMVLYYLMMPKATSDVQRNAFEGMYQKAVARLGNSKVKPAPGRIGPATGCIHGIADF